ncbi:MAG: hypothetical protein GQ565_01045 [Candidatus Aegiribacteria sp.]|nr:hypothetical protein [Candidatus Aegiribacteria sp.]
MGQRLIDYALVAIVLLAVFGLFKLSRILLQRLLKRLRSRYSVFGTDRMLVTALYFLLAGLLFLPAFTSILAVINSRYLTGGIAVHLVLVAISIVLFSIAEDLFRDFSASISHKNWSIGRHFRYVSVPFITFWALGCVFISPLFYSGLTLVLALFYLYALSCRPGTGNRVRDKSS